MKPCDQLSYSLALKALIKIGGPQCQTKRSKHHNSANNFDMLYWGQSVIPEGFNGGGGGHFDG